MSLPPHSRFRPSYPYCLEPPHPTTAQHAFYTHYAQPAHRPPPNAWPSYFHPSNLPPSHVPAVLPCFNPNANPFYNPNNQPMHFYNRPINFYDPNSQPIHPALPEPRPPPFHPNLLCAVPCAYPYICAPLLVTQPLWQYIASFHTAMCNLLADNNGAIPDFDRYLINAPGCTNWREARTFGELHPLIQDLARATVAAELRDADLNASFVILCFTYAATARDACGRVLVMSAGTHIDFGTRAGLVNEALEKAAKAAVKVALRFIEMWDMAAVVRAQMTRT